MSSSLRVLQLVKGHTQENYINKWCGQASRNTKFLPHCIHLDDFPNGCKTPYACWMTFYQIGGMSNQSHAPHAPLHGRMHNAWSLTTTQHTPWYVSSTPAPTLQLPPAPSPWKCMLKQHILTGSSSQGSRRGEPLGHLHLIICITKVCTGQSTEVTWDDICKHPPTGLTLSPVAMIPHKSCQ